MQLPRQPNMDITLPLVDHDGLDAGDLGDGHGNEFSANLIFQLFSHGQYQFRYK